MPAVQQIGRAHARIERDEQLRRLRDESFDVAVIGGGINGAAIARDAAMRGFRVALVERADFAGATSSCSSKLIHGGLRYLPQGQLRLVRGALRERERLRLVTAPHLVLPLRFLVPVYRGDHPGRFALSAGLILYDLLAGAPRGERHHRLAAARVSDFEPKLKTTGLTGGAVYFDAWGDDARLTLENVLDAAYHGAAVANYVAVAGFSKNGGKLAAAHLRDLADGAEFELRARRFINAAGPWSDDIRLMDDAQAAPAIRLTKGVHLVVSAKLLALRNALLLNDGAGRVVFVMPHDGYVLIGTTDTDYAGDRANVVADAQDITYLLGVVAGVLPDARITPGDIAYSFAGLRALTAGRRGLRPSAVSREDVTSVSPSGLQTIAGGKLTTHREMAERVVDRLGAALGRRGIKAVTTEVPLPGARPLTMDTKEADVYRRAMAELPLDIRPMLIGRYGQRAAQIARLAHRRAELAARLAPGAPAIGAEVVYTVRAEMARSVADFLIRRTAMVWRAPHHAAAAAPAVAHIMAGEFGWDHARECAELEHFMRSVHLSQGQVDARSVSDSEND
ncbi:MAG: FAD-dependent oxidoreductase [Candidatus Binataceae bacterium]